MQPLSCVYGDKSRMKWKQLNFNGNFYTYYTLVYWLIKYVKWLIFHSIYQNYVLLKGLGIVLNIVFDRWNSSLCKPRVFSMVVFFSLLQGTDHLGSSSWYFQCHLILGTIWIEPLLCINLHFLFLNFTFLCQNFNVAFGIKLSFKPL